MPTAHYVFHHRLIDYAGLFPPTSLPLAEAVRNYAAYQASPEAWLLGRFICPADQLNALDTAAFTPAAPLELSTLVPRVDTAAELLPTLEQTLKTMTAFSVERGPSVTLPSIEMPLPGAVRDRADLRTLLGSAARVLDASPLTLTPYFEVTPGTDLTATLEAIAEYNTTRFRPAGFKLRCGGATPEAVPSVEQVARVLTLCRDTGVALKCTAGLHHPLRRYDATAQTHLHGFINVFGAGLLARVQQLGPAETCAILADEDPAHFTFTDEAFIWRDLRADLPALIAARATSLISFGSCSFDEPREALKKLGWL